MFGEDPDGREGEESVADIGLTSPTNSPAQPPYRSRSVSSKSTERSAAPAAGGADASDEVLVPMPLDSEPTNLVFTLNGHVLDQEFSIFRAVQEFGSAQEAAEEPSTEFRPASKAMWSDVYTLRYQREEGPGCNAGAVSKHAAAVVEIEKSVAGPATTVEDGTSSDRLLATVLRSQVAGVPHGDSREAISDIEDLLIILRLANWLVTPARRRQLGLAKAVADRATVVDTDELYDSTLANMVLRQLQDPLTLCSGAIPQWMGKLMRTCSFAFPFECKRQFFVCTFLGISRALSRLQQCENLHGGTAAGQETRNNVMRVQRQKVRISRTRVLDSADKVMEMYSSHRAILEVEFFGEAGTGLVRTSHYSKFRKMCAAVAL